MNLRTSEEARELTCPFSFEAPQRWAPGMLRVTSEGGPLCCAGNLCMGWIDHAVIERTNDANDDEVVSLGYCARLHPNGVEG